jgi:hypothetical protein
LQRKNVVRFAIITLGPDVCAAFGVNELPGDPHAISHLAYAALKDVAHAKLATDLLHINCPTLVSEGRVASDDEQPLDPR